LWTLAGRLKDVSFVCSPKDVKMLGEHKRGESDLLRRDGAWYLLTSVDVPEQPEYEPKGFVGVDLGIVNIATTSDGKIMAGRGLNRHRQRQRELRAKLQAKATKAAKRLLKKRRRKEQRHDANVNHIISKKIVTEAERTGRGVALEQLKGIRERVRLRKPQRVTLHSWAFHQLGQFLQYKALRAGVPLVFVDAAYTSQQCAECGFVDGKNRVDQAVFVCRRCGVVAHTDRNASRNIAARGETAWNAGRESRVPATP
jgi:IS605 OrfB family transposase